jgi:hypothetical protein
MVLKTIGLAEPLRSALKPFVLGDSRGLRIRFGGQRPTKRLAIPT